MEASEGQGHREKLPEAKQSRTTLGRTGNSSRRMKAVCGGACKLSPLCLPSEICSEIHMAPMPWVCGFFKEEPGCHPGNPTADSKEMMRLLMPNSHL